jgi:hypothetical protein
MSSCDHLPSWRSKSADNISLASHLRHALLRPEVGLAVVATPSMGVHILAKELEG